MQSEIDQLRAELRDLHYLTEAVLMSIVGKDRMVLYEIEARVQSSVGRERRGTPLREVGVVGRANDRLTSGWGDGFDILTLEELVRQLPRERVTAIDGIGRMTMQKLDHAVAERGLTWAEA